MPAGHKGDHQDPKGSSRPGTPANPLKDEGQSKATTSRLADHARPGSNATPARDTATGQGGSDKGARHAADTAHPSQHGGVRADDPASDPRHSATQKRSGEKTAGPSPADEPDSTRTGTAHTDPASEGDDSRAGRTKGERPGRDNG